MTKSENSQDLDFTRRTLEIIEAAKQQGMPMRAMGAIAFRLHCPRFSYLFENLERTISDIDLVSFSKYRSDVKKLLSGYGFAPNERFMAAAYAEGRHIYYDKNNRCVDVFFDSLEMCHTINFKARLELDYPTITLADLFLEKMQIVELTEKDMKDIVVLVLEHQMGDTEKEVVNVKYIADLLSRDWGFYHTVTTNLRRVKEFLNTCEALSEGDRNSVAGRIDQALQKIEGVPKSLKWRMRSEIGIRKKWYNDVETR